MIYVVYRKNTVSSATLSNPNTNRYATKLFMPDGTYWCFSAQSISTDYWEQQP